MADDFKMNRRMVLVFLTKIHHLLKALQILLILFQLFRQDR